MRRSLTILYNLSGALAAFCILSITLLVFAQVCLNLVDKLAVLFAGQAIGLTIPSYSDFTGFLLAASTFLGLAYTLRAGGHIRVTLVTGLLGDRVRRRVETLVLAAALAMVAYGTVYMGQTLKFLAPVRPGDMVLAEVTVSDIIHAKRRVALECKCTVGDTVVLKGDAMVLAPSRKFD